MQPQKGLSIVRIIVILVVATLVFGGGVWVGYEYRPEEMKVSGVMNLVYSSTSTAANDLGIELKTCVDDKNTEVPCLIDREEVKQKTNGPGDFNQFWKVWNIINDKYVPTKNKPVSNQEKVWGAISGLANSLGDPYTYFLPPQEKSLFEQDVRGQFGGIGMQVGMSDGIVTAVATLKGSPAERAGILKGDKILKIDDATTTNMTIDKALYLIRGEVGKPVTLTLYREGKDEPFKLTIIREIIRVPTVDTEQRDDIFIIRLYGFPETGAGLFRGALRQFVESGTDKLVLDLRGNPGGYIEVATDIASWFLPEGKVIVKEEEKNGVGRIYRSKGYNIFNEGFHFVILIDGGSASAAEILAAALSQHHIATLVGKKTFGKGSVQELIPVTDDTAIKITVARWITPNGTSLSEGGIDPDVDVEITKKQYEKGEDPQLDQAISILHKTK